MAEVSHEAAPCASAVILGFSYTILQSTWHYADEQLELFTGDDGKYEIFRRQNVHRMQSGSLQQAMARCLEQCRHLGNIALS